jgi:hypothetical protein
MRVRKRISQETFEQAVQENMELFEMDRAEAVADAVKQFEMEGVDLSNIVQSVEGPVTADDASSVVEGGTSGADAIAEHPVVRAARSFAEEVVESEPNVAKLAELLGALRSAAADEAKGEAAITLAGEHLCVEALCTAISRLHGAVVPREAAAGLGRDGDTASVGTDGSLAASRLAVDLDGTPLALLATVPEEAEAGEGGRAGGGGGGGGEESVGGRSLESVVEGDAAEVAGVGELAPPAAWRAWGSEELESVLGDALELLVAVCGRHEENASHVPGHFASVLSAVVVHCESQQTARAEGDEWALGERLRRVAAGALSGGAMLARKREGVKRALKEGGGLGAGLRLVRENRGDASLARATWALLRAVLAHDDEGASISKTFDYARELGGDPRVAALVADVARLHATNALVVADSCGALRALAVNDEICVALDRAHVIETTLLPLVAPHLRDARVARAALSLLRALANSDRLKRSICGTLGGAPLRLVLEALTIHARDPGAADLALATLSNVTLRIPENAPLVLEAGAAPLIAQAMRLHPDHAHVQRSACMAVRNIVSRNKDLWPTLADEGIEALVRKARRAHPDLCNDVAYAALRDAGLD